MGHNKQPVDVSGEQVGPESYGKIRPAVSSLGRTGVGECVEYLEPDSNEAAVEALSLGKADINKLRDYLKVAGLDEHIVTGFINTMLRSMRKGEVVLPPLPTLAANLPKGYATPLEFKEHLLDALSIIETVEEFTEEAGDEIETVNLRPSDARYVINMDKLASAIRTGDIEYARGMGEWRIRKLAGFVEKRTAAILEGLGPQDA